MQVHEKLKIMRLFKDMTQEEMAEKLGYSLNGYTKIERGETDITVNKLEKIAEILGLDLHKLLSLDEGNIFNIAEQCNYGIKNVVVLTESQCTQELEKAQLQLELKDKELAMQAREIAYLKKMLEMSEKLNGENNASHSNY